MSWRDYGACIGESPELFFDIYEKDKHFRENVRALCESCPVKNKCYEEAENNKLTGVWGGKWFDQGKPTSK